MKQHSRLLVVGKQGVDVGGGVQTLKVQASKVQAVIVSHAAADMLLPCAV